MLGLHCDLQASLVVVHRLGCHAACGIPWSWIQTASLHPLTGRWILNHWTTKEVLSLHVIWKFFYTVLACLLLQLLTRIFQITSTLLILTYLLALHWHQWCWPYFSFIEKMRAIRHIFISVPLLQFRVEKNLSSSSVLTLHGLPCYLSASCPLTCSVSCVLTLSFLLILPPNLQIYSNISYLK